MSDLTHEQIVEKVSKAICMVNCHNPDAVLTDNLDHSKWEIYVPDARAAISTIAEVLKEPTEAMVSEGDELFPFARGTESHAMSGGLTPETVFRAMLAASPLHEEKV